MRKSIFSFLTVLVLLGVSVFAIVQTARLQNARQQIADMHLQALSQSAEEMQALTLSLEKLLISTQAARQAELLHAIALGAGDVQQCLSALPLDSEAMASVLALTGRLQADASALLPQLARSGIPQQAREQLTSDLAACTRLSSQLALARNAATADLSSFLTQEGSPLPAARIPDAPRGLPDGEITREEARQAARDFLGGSNVTALTDAPDVSGVLPAYGITVESGGIQLNMEITRQGGKVLWMMPETASFAMTHTADECIAAGIDFLETHGFGPTQAVYWQIYDGLCVISAAPLQDGVLLYPDLLSVQVRMDTLQIVGLEAHAYWTNHIERSIPVPALSEAQARARLSDEVVCTDTHLCLIPGKDGERLCWQCTCMRLGDTYYIYIDALTGDEAAIRKIIPLENGATAA